MIKPIPNSQSDALAQKSFEVFQNAAQHLVRGAVRESDVN